VTLPDLSRYDVVALDTETTGLGYTDRPVGLSWATPDGRSQYLAWGHPEGNNTSLREVREWAKRELTRPGVRRIFHHATFDLRMLAYVGITGVTGAECTQVQAALIDENRKSMALDALAKEAGIDGKADAVLNEYCAKHFGGKATRDAQGKNYHRAPGHIVGPYAAHDTVMTLGVDAWQQPQLDREGVRRVYRLETDLIPVLVRMHLCGVRVDPARAYALRTQLMAEKAALLQEWSMLKDDEREGGLIISRPKVMGHLLDSLGIAYSKTKTGLPSITKEFLEKLDHPLGAAVRKLRQIAHFDGTFIQGYVLDNVRGDDHVVHGEFHATRNDKYGTTSGRLSSGGALNLQNLPARDEILAPLVRSLFVPMRTDQVWLKSDYSQIEYRFFAHFCGQLARYKAKRGRGNGHSAMEQAYLDDARIDFHDWVAATAGIKRKRAKNVNFCKLYGGGIAKIADTRSTLLGGDPAKTPPTAGCSVEEAEEFVAAYEEKIPEAIELQKDVNATAARRGFIWTWYGRKARFMTHKQYADRWYRQKRGETDEQWAERYQAVVGRRPSAYRKTHSGLNRALQGSAADLQKLAMIEVDKAIDWDGTQLHLSVHDELDLSVPRDGAEEQRQLVTTIMQDVSRTPDWKGDVMRVPVIAETSLGPNWGACA
jgi:DNA polymerase-1